MENKVGLILGISGQDGSYLSELLLDKDYKVYGMIRRSSVNTTERIAHILHHPNFELVDGDITDASCMHRLISGIKPDEVYNCAAQSDVRVSFDIPSETFNINAIGTLNILDAIRLMGSKSRLYHCSTSELFGNSPHPQNEDTPMNPQSPYAVAKLAAHNLVKLYRDAYGLFACAGILMNHESILKNAPVITKDDNGFIDVVPIEDMFKTDKHKYEGLLDKYRGLSVWNGEKWTEILGGNCYRDTDKKVKLVQTVGGCYEATEDHVVFDEDDHEIKTKDLVVGQKLTTVRYPDYDASLVSDLDFARFVGFLVAEGHIGTSGKIRLTGCDKELLICMANYVCKQFGWTYRLETWGPGGFVESKKDVWQLDINNDSNFGKWLHKNVYTLRSREKKVPTFVLNAGKEVYQAFFDGYYEGDGLKAGHVQYRYKGWTTSSATLCLGLILILQKISPDQIPKVKCEYRPNNGKSGGRYYYCHLTTDDKLNTKGTHRIKNKAEIVKILETKSSDGWFYDLTTESETFAVGPNLVKIHNSPRRGEKFVTRKITIYVARLFHAIKNNGGITPKDWPKLALGNLEAKRDWGFAGDYVKAMWLMLQQDEPNDYVISSGESHSIREFLDLAFSHIGLDYREYVEVDPKFFRPTEVNHLCGDSTKARQELGWSPEVSFEQLVSSMMESDIQFHGG